MYLLTYPQQGGALTAAFKGLKQRFTFLLPRFGLMEALEAAKVGREGGTE